LTIGLRTYAAIRAAHRATQTANRGIPVQQVTVTERAGSGLVIAPADEGRAHRAFVRLPYELYRRDRNWAPPLRSEERKRWSPSDNASLERRWIGRYVAMRDGRVVGRIAAIIDRDFASAWEPDTGSFGFFECVDDPEVAEALFATAERALAARGARRILGPVNLTTHDETGILLDGFDKPATVMSPYNWPYYSRLLEAAGYEPYKDYQAFAATPDSPASPTVQRIVSSARAGRGRWQGVTLRNVDLEHWDRDARIIHELYNAAFADVWGFVPIGWDEFDQRARRMRPFLRPELLPIVEVDGQPAGFGLTVPDINEALIHANGRLLPFGWLKIARNVKRIRTVRFIILAVQPEHVGRGIGALLAMETQDAARRLGYTHLDLSLVQDVNHRVRRIIDAFGGRPAKTFRRYCKRIATSAEAIEREVA
jgi:GNAT superfamily N-acetyltransferase